MVGFFSVMGSERMKKNWHLFTALYDHKIQGEMKDKEVN